MHRREEEVSATSPTLPRDPNEKLFPWCCSAVYGSRARDPSFQWANKLEMAIIEATLTSQ